MKNEIVYYNLYVFTRFLLLCLCVNPVLALFCRFWKPFNPLLGETFEYIDEERGYTVIAEQVYCDVYILYILLCLKVKTHGIFRKYLLPKPQMHPLTRKNVSIHSRMRLHIF